MLKLQLQAEKDKAEKQDQESLQDLLTSVTGNYSNIRQKFDLRNEQDEDQAMAAMERVSERNCTCKHEGTNSLETEEREYR